MTDCAHGEDDDRLRVLMVCTSYPQDLKDWRGLFMRHLADALARRKDVELRLWAPPGEVHPSIVADPPGAEHEWLARLMAAGGIAHLYRSAGLLGLLEVAKLLIFLRRAYKRNKNAELFHVNWLQNVLPLPRNGRPVLLTALGTDMQLLRLPLMKTFLRRQFKGRPVVICPNADWMVAPLQQSFGDLAKVEYVPFGIDPGWFAIQRSHAQLPARWLVITRLTRAKLGRLFEDCAPFFLGANGRQLHLIGPMQEQIEIPTWVRYHGAIGPDDLKEKWFPSATGLITLSQHAEGRPQVMLEAMAAGLPIIASSIEAHASLLKNKETGYLIQKENDLSEAFQYLEHPAENKRIGLAARAWVRSKVGTWDDCAARYRWHYRNLMNMGMA